MLNQIHYRSFFMMIIFLLSSLILTYAAEPIPPATDDYINDYANVLTPDDKNKMEEEADNFYKKTGMVLKVVTIDSMRPYIDHSNTTLEEFESFTQRFFDQWEIGNAKHNTGILLLFTKQEQYVRIELGLGFQHYYNMQMERVVDNVLLPNFRNENYSQGLSMGTSNIIKEISAEITWKDYLRAYMWYIIGGVLIIISILAGISCMKSGKKGWGWIFFTIAGMILFFLIRMAMRSGGKSGGRSGGGGASGSW